jgi:deoxyribodipyrimidine photo-lyase
MTMPVTLKQPLSRGAALARLAQFLPLAGEEYAQHRNHVGCACVSHLSAAIRRRLISEEEVVRAVLGLHGPKQAQSFLSEVLWRSYWKGWLEQRPTVWTDYLVDVAAEQALVNRSQALSSALWRAENGQTGIDAFDHWIGELRGTGYIHNWARMQIASIWIFTLKLPWVLGADFTLRHFIDADPASNTLSWRWVAGLHTPGKTYLADPARIEAMTNGAFQPASLAMHATPPECAANPPAQPLRDAQPWQTGKPTLLVLTPDDLSLETVAPQTLNVAAVVAPSELFATHAHREAAKDAMERAMQHWRCPVIGFVPIAALEDHSRKFAVRQWVMPYAPVGSPAHIMTAFAQEANYPWANYAARGTTISGLPATVDFLL